MEQDNRCGLHEKAELVQTLIDILNATWTNAGLRYINKKILEYQEQRRTCVELGIDVTRYDAKANEFTRELNPVPYLFK